MRILQKTRLEAASVRKAWYELQLVELAEGFAVIKRSGPQTARGIEEAWFRWSFEQAEKKFLEIKHKKTTKKVGRQYKEVPVVESQEVLLPLFHNSNC